jgi:hypothetical protein
MADPDLVRPTVTHLAADLPSRAIRHELIVASYSEAEILDGWVEARLLLHRVDGPREGQTHRTRQQDGFRADQQLRPAGRYLRASTAMPRAYTWSMPRPSALVR